MKYYTFYRESNKFDDILNDKVLKKYIDYITIWKNYLRVGINKEYESKVNIHITLKYGDELRNHLSNDYSPKPHIDYTPRKTP